MSGNTSDLVTDVQQKLQIVEQGLQTAATNLDDIAFELTAEMKEWPAAKIRSTFVNYFVEKREHTFWPSSPVVPHNDPTLLFINAGESLTH
jgi:hypothetical protein